jgi:hypothetical protein
LGVSKTLRKTKIRGTLKNKIDKTKDSQGHKILLQDITVLWDILSEPKK